MLRIYEDEVIEEALYIVETNSTVREAAVKFGKSKSTIHNHVTFVLEKIDRELYKKVKDVLDNNKSEWHIRGGKATQAKYKGCKKA